MSTITSLSRAALPSPARHPAEVHLEHGKNCKLLIDAVSEYRLALYLFPPPAIRYDLLEKLAPALKTLEDYEHAELAFRELIKEASPENMMHLHHELSLCGCQTGKK